MGKLHMWIIGLDLDGVIVDHTENRLAFAREHGFDLALRETASDLIKKILPKAAYEDMQAHLYDDPAVALTPPLVAGARMGIETLSARRIPFFLVSRRKMPEFALELIKSHGLWPEFFSEKNTFFVSTKKDKDREAERLGVSVYVDDQPSVLKELGSVEHKFLFDPLGAYNNHVGDYKTVSSWNEFLSELEKLE